MRFIPTFDARVEQLKKQAKKLRSQRGGKHAEHLDRLARGAGYDHWHHVTWCHKMTASKRGAQALIAECVSIRDAEMRGEVKLVMTGPEIDSTIGPFVLFSTGVGDAWLLDPEEDLAMAIVWRGTPSEFGIRETERAIEVDWDAEFELLGQFMRFEAFDERIESKAVGGYPLDAVRQLIDRALSVHKKIDLVIGQHDAIELTPEVIDDLVRQGWQGPDLNQAARDGFRYCPSRNSLLGPVMTDEEFMDDEREP